MIKKYLAIPFQMVTFLKHGEFSPPFFGEALMGCSCCFVVPRRKRSKEAEAEAEAQVPQSKVGGAPS